MPRAAEPGRAGAVRVRRARRAPASVPVRRGRVLEGPRWAQGARRPETPRLRRPGGGPRKRGGPHVPRWGFGEKKPRASASFSSPAATPGRVTTVVAKNAASAPSRLPRTSSTSKTSSQDRSPAAASSFFSRRAPSSVHAAADASSWRATYAELAKVPPSRMLPVVSALLDDLREVESARTKKKSASSFELPAGIDAQDPASPRRVSRTRDFRVASRGFFCARDARGCARRVAPL